MNVGFKRGNRYSYTNSTGVAIANSQLVILSPGPTTGFIGIAITSIAIAGSGELAIGGGDERVVSIAKKVGEAFTDGQILYWDPFNQWLTGTSGSNTRSGRSYGVFNSAATTAALILNA
jgi:predicted RecA/RadA family phage recombinase